MPRYITEINQAYSHMAPAIENIVRHGIPSDADIIYAGRNTIARVMIDGTPVIVKAFRPPRAINAIVYTTLRRSKAERSFLNATRIIEAGFHTPDPIAYGEVRSGISLRESYYFSTEIKGEDLRYWERRADREELTDALAAELSALCDAGICHLDLSPGNIMFTRDDDGRYTFYYIDLNRMNFNVTDRKALMTAVFERLNELEPVMELAKKFARVAGTDEEETVEAARRARLSFLSRINRKRLLKQYLWPK